MVGRLLPPGSLRAVRRLVLPPCRPLRAGRRITLPLPPLRLLLLLGPVACGALHLLLPRLLRPGPPHVTASSLSLLQLAAAHHSIRRLHLGPIEHGLHLRPGAATLRMHHLLQQLLPQLIGRQPFRCGGPLSPDAARSRRR